MYLLILIITAVGALPFTDTDEETSNTRCWTVSSPQDASIMAYQYQKKADAAGKKIKVRLIGLDLSTMTAEEMKIPAIIFKDNVKAEAAIITTKAGMDAARLVPEKGVDYARK